MPTSSMLALLALSGPTRTLPTYAVRTYVARPRTRQRAAPEIPESAAASHVLVADSHSEGSEGAVAPPLPFAIDAAPAPLLELGATTLPPPPPPPPLGSAVSLPLLPVPSPLRPVLPPSASQRRLNSERRALPTVSDAAAAGGGAGGPSTSTRAEGTSASTRAEGASASTRAGGLPIGRSDRRRPAPGGGEGRASEGLFSPISTAEVEALAARCVDGLYVELQRAAKPPRRARREGGAPPNGCAGAGASPKRLRGRPPNSHVPSHPKARKEGTGVVFQEGGGGHFWPLILG